MQRFGQIIEINFRRRKLMLPCSPTPLLFVNKRRKIGRAATQAFRLPPASERKIAAAVETAENANACCVSINQSYFSFAKDTGSFAPLTEQQSRNAVTNSFILINDRLERTENVP